jgi:hypothetical protein
MRLSNPHITSERLRHHRVSLLWQTSLAPTLQSMIKNFSLGTYRTCATIAWEVANMLSLPPPTLPLPRPVGERKGAGGKVRAAKRAP